MIRHEKIVLTAVTWTDDVQVEWAGPEGVCEVSASLDYYHADARIILRRGPNEQVLASGLGEKWSYKGRYALADGDAVVLQWRALTPAVGAVSEVAELSIEEIADQFVQD